MNGARLLQIIASSAALVAVSLGMGTYTHADFTSIHMPFGLIGLRRWGAIGIVYALIVPIFGVTPQMILAGDLRLPD
jgi:hypothetical protein